MGLQSYLDVAHAPDPGVLQRLLVNFAHEREFGLVSATLVIDRHGRRLPAEYHFVSNTPQAFLDAAHSADEGRRDPVLARLKTASMPFVYDRQLYVDADAADLWERQAAFGYHSGIAVALHLPEHRHFFFGIDREGELPPDDQLVRLMADLQLMAVHAQEAAVRLFAPPRDTPLPRLTAREREILRWTMEGKSAWAIGQILGISEHTVNFHAKNLFRKLDVANKHQAVVKALTLGLL